MYKPILYKKFSNFSPIHLELQSQRRKSLQMKLESVKLNNKKKDTIIKVIHGNKAYKVKENRRQTTIFAML